MVVLVIQFRVVLASLMVIRLLVVISLLMFFPGRCSVVSALKRKYHVVIRYQPKSYTFVSSGDIEKLYVTV